jgi:hypothetical protein
MEQNAATQASYVPTSTNPLAFFYYFFVKSGLKIFRNDFFNLEENNYSSVVDWNLEEEYIAFRDYDYEKDEECVDKVLFSDVLRNLLINEYYYATDNIESRIRELTKEKNVRFFVKQVLEEARYILGKVITSADASRYHVSQNSILAITSFVFERYPTISAALREEFDLDTKIMDENQRLFLTLNKPKTFMEAANSKRIYALKWKGDSLWQIEKLFKELIEKTVIAEDTDWNVFQKAFDGSLLVEPLKIRWILKVNGKLSKPLILFFFDNLMLKNLVYSIGYTTKLYQTIQMIFTDFDGQTLKHFKNSNSQIFHRNGGETKEEKIVLGIIESLINSPTTT